MLRSRTIAGRITGPYDPQHVADPTHMPPVVFTNPANMPSPLPPGATVAPVTLPPTWIEGALDADSLKQYYEVGMELQKYGFLQGFDFAGALGAIGAGTAVAGPWGAAVAALLFVVGWITNGSVAAEWQQSGVGVHAYVATLMPEVFAGGNGWARQNTPGAFASLPNLRKCYLIWTIQEWGIVLDPLERIYNNTPNSTMFRDDTPNWSEYGQNAPAPNVRQAIISLPAVDSMPQWVVDEYALYGIDYHASVELRRAGNHGRGFAMIKSGIEVSGMPNGTEYTREDEDEDNETTAGGGAALAAAALIGYALTQN